MGGKRLEDYWSYEMKSFLKRYRQFETLIPASSGKGAAHRGEDGRYIESILKETLQKFLPEGIEILTGFILRAGVESDMSGRARRKDADKHSSQLDLLLYDTQNYPVYQRFGDTAVVLPEGLLGVISVKKTLRTKEIAGEIMALRQAAQLCSQEGRKGPFLALVGMDDELGKKYKTRAGVIERNISNIFTQKPVCYEELPCFIGNLSEWTIHKCHKLGIGARDRRDNERAEYQMYIHQNDEEHLGLQFLLKGILDVYYSTGRNHGKQPGFFSFPEGKQYDWKSKEIHCDMTSALYIKDCKEETSSIQ
ncbi:MAG: hypothetical protein NC314_06305 [Roseburia sp.]|nr:hypothetical protein [Roseburia sp.]MCM1242437.1 hypothetical protein [Roseburia sp.]